MSLKAISNNLKSESKNDHKHEHKSTKKTPTEFKASILSISTCTVLINLNSKLNLALLSRFLNIYDQNSKELDEHAGGIYNLEFYGNCARGETLIDRIKSEFNNQSTIKFKYCGYRKINIKFFANGKLQMTGLRYENEAKEVATLLINIINKVNLNIIKNINNLKDVSKMFDFQLVYDETTKNVFYYRKYFDRFLKDYNFDTNLVYDDNKNQSNNNNNNNINNTNNKSNNNNQSNNNTSHVNFNRKGYIKGIHDLYVDTIENDNQEYLKENEWSGDNYIKMIIDKLERLKSYFTKELETSLINSTSLIEVKKNIESLMKIYTDFKFNSLDKLLSDISKNMFSTDEQTLIDIKSEVFKFNKIYKNLLENKINRLISIRTIDIDICNSVKKYLNIINYDENEYKNDHINDNSNITIPLEDLELKTNIIETPHNYFISGTETVLINSDFSINHNINLKKISKILLKQGLFNSYEPDEYPGVLTKYYYNPNNTIQGICNCTPHCSTKEKHSVCTKITISIFRTGSVIITGARNNEHLISAHDKIIKILKDNIDIIKGIDCEDDHKHIAILNNEFRKISKKTRLFFIKKSNIIDYDKIVN